MEKDTGLQPEMPSSTEKVRKKYGESAREANKYPKTIEKVRKVRKKYGNMNTKGAGAEGTRPLCGAAKSRPSYFRTFSALVQYFPYFFDSFWILVCFSSGLFELCPYCFRTALHLRVEADIFLHILCTFSVLFSVPSVLFR